MRNCKIDYTGLKPADLHDLCAGVITSLTGNTNFPALPVALATMTARNTALQTALNEAVNRDRVKLAEVRQAKAVITATLRDTAVYVNTVSDGDEVKLLSSGLTLNKIPEKRGLPAQVVNLKALFTNSGGKINLVWDKAQFAKTYNVWVSADEGTTWSLMDTTYSRRLLCESLVSCTRYSFKVVAANQYGKAPESDVATQIAA